jgi:signal transduction histidine kinase
MLLLLGDQLIRDAGLAVFELVKNAYDADATACDVTLARIEDPESARIIVEDDGSGMDYETVVGTWLEPGTDYRASQRSKKVRSPRYRRLPLGEKGVGRFAVHKLGRRIELVTRKPGGDEVVVAIDWRAFEREKYLSDVGVDVKTRKPEYFTGKRHGTRIEVTDLRTDWNRRRVRELHRSVTSICSPFQAPDHFSARLILRPQSDWLKGLLAPETVLEQSLYHAKGSIAAGRLKLDYAFTPLAEMESKLEGRVVKVAPMQVMTTDAKSPERLVLDPERIGTVRFEFSIFDLDPAVLELVATDKAGLRDYLNTNGGVRVYRDGVRVFDMGEPGNDWLELESRRVNRPTVKIGNNQIIGAIHLDGGDSQGLVEKTNREGFLENECYHQFREAVKFALTQVEAERVKDKNRIRRMYSRKSAKEPVMEELSTLRSEVAKRGLTKELGGYLDRIEKQFTDVRERLLTAAGPGLTLSVVVHEVEKIIKELAEALRMGAKKVKVAALVHHLSEIVDGLSFLVRKSGNSRERASVLIKQALFNTSYRLKAHHITVTNGIEDEGDKDFSVSCTRRLVISTLMNLIDNSIYWLENRGAPDKQLYLGTSMDLGEGPALVVADNGPGFQDPPEYLTEAFFTRKSDGMGLGLHIANEIAKIHHGRLKFPEPDELDLPKQFRRGAIVAFVFAKLK